MSEKTSFEGERDELDPAEILRLLYARKVRIGLLTFLVGLATAGLTLLLPNNYESSTSIVIRAPELPLAGEARPLTIEMLQALTGSIEVKWEAYKKARETGALDEEESSMGEQAGFRVFQRRLRTSVGKQTGPDAHLLPMISLMAQAKTPESSAKIANAWARIVLDRSQEIHTGGIGDQGGYFEKMYDEANRKLVESETNLTSASLEAKLTLSKMELTEVTKQRSRLLGASLAMEHEIGTEENLLERVLESLGDQEIDAVWVGEIRLLDPESSALSAKAQASSLTRRIVTFASHIQEKEAELAEFEETSNLQYLEMQFRNKERQLAKIAGEIVSDRSRLAGLVTQHAELSKELAKTDERVVLNKALTNDALFNAAMADLLSQDMKIPILKNEIYNPLYENLKTDVTRLAAESKGLQSRIASLGEEETKLGKEIAVLAKTVALLTAERDALRTALGSDRTHFSFMEEEYNKHRKQRESLETGLLRKRAEWRVKQSQLDDLTTETVRLEEHILTSQDRMSALTRDVENRKNVRTSLASKAEAMRLQISQKETSRSGTIQLYSAQANPQKVSPQRTKIVLGAMFASVVVFSLFFLAMNVIREEESS